jgi:hypothetical protein
MLKKRRPLEFLALSPNLPANFPDNPDQQVQLVGPVLSGGHSRVLSFVHMEVLTNDDVFGALVAVPDRLDPEAQPMPPPQITLRGVRIITDNPYPVPEHVVVQGIASRTATSFNSVGQYAYSGPMRLWFCAQRLQGAAWTGLSVLVTMRFRTF